MFIGVVSLLMIIGNIVIKKNKCAYGLLFIWMWIIMAFTYNIADEGIYLSRYNNLELWDTQTEYVYEFIIRVCRSIGLNFYQFKAFITLVQLLLVFHTIQKIGTYPNLIAALYFVYPFAMNVAQMRSALATAVFIFGFRYLIDDKEKK